jgi:hypothetical protein
MQIPPLLRLRDRCLRSYLLRSDSRYFERYCTPHKIGVSCLQEHRSFLMGTQSTSGYSGNAHSSLKLAIFPGTLSMGLGYRSNLLGRSSLSARPSAMTLCTRSTAKISSSSALISMCLNLRCGGMVHYSTALQDKRTRSKCPLELRHIFDSVKSSISTRCKARLQMYLSAQIV